VIRVKNDPRPREVFDRPFQRGVEGRLAHVDSDCKHFSVRIKEINCREKRREEKERRDSRTALETQFRCIGGRCHN
jgi:hypothetical protein